MNPRHDLAAARIALRAAEDGEATLKAIIAGQAQGTNDVARKAHTAELLLHSDDYQDALRELRAAQAAVDHAQACVDIANDELRRAELDARIRLAEVLAGKRADDAVIDNIDWYEVAQHAERAKYDAIEEQYNKTHVIHPDHNPLAERAEYRPRPLIDDCESPF